MQSDQTLIPPVMTPPQGTNQNGANMDTLAVNQLPGAQQSAYAKLMASMDKLNTSAPVNPTPDELVKLLLHGKDVRKKHDTFLHDTGVTSVPIAKNASTSTAMVKNASTIKNARVSTAKPTIKNASCNALASLQKRGTVQSKNTPTTATKSQVLIGATQPLFLSGKTITKPYKTREKRALTIPPKPFFPSAPNPMMQQPMLPQQQQQQMAGAPLQQGAGRPSGPVSPAGGQIGVAGQPSAVASLGGQTSTPTSKGFGNTPSTGGSTPGAKGAPKSPGMGKAAVDEHLSKPEPAKKTFLQRWGLPLGVAIGSAASIAYRNRKDILGETTPNVVDRPYIKNSKCLKTWGSGRDVIYGTLENIGVKTAGQTATNTDRQKTANLAQLNSAELKLALFLGTQASDTTQK